MERYIIFQTEFAFRRFFGTENNRELTAHFLNTLLSGNIVIKQLRFLGDRCPLHVSTESNVYDFLCEDEKDETVLVEVQKAEHDHLYSNPDCFFNTFPLLGGSPIDADVKLRKIYTIGILNFTFDDGAEYLHFEENRADASGSKKGKPELTRLYVEIPKFNKTESELETMLDKWLFVYKNLGSMEEIPTALYEPTFERLFKLADMSFFSDGERLEYDSSLMNLWDWNAVLEYAYKQGRTMGKKIAQAEELLATGKFSIKETADLVGLSVHEVKENVKLKK